MVYSSGKQDHTMPAEAMVEHIVELVTEKAAIFQAEIDAKKALDAAAASRVAAVLAAE